MWQSWRQLLFLHWKFDPTVIQRTLPAGLTVDTFEAAAYVGVVPFFMSGVRPRFCLPLPGVSNFLELNVRTYVHDENGIPGVWFYSLDANCAPAVWAARGFFRLPYQHAAMHADVSEGGWVDYRCRRKGVSDDAVYRYRRVLEGRREAGVGTLEYFLLERYYLYAHDERRRRLLRGQVAHAPYQFCPVEIEAFSSAPMLMAGLEPDDTEPCHRCAAADVDVRVIGIRAV
jgi:uncharacterized protein YqjF (DUF2071 family)